MQINSTLLQVMIQLLHQLGLRHGNIVLIMIRMPLQRQFLFRFTQFTLPSLARAQSTPISNMAIILGPPSS